MNYFTRILIVYFLTSIVILGQSIETKKFTRTINKSLPSYIFIITDISSNYSHPTFIKVFKIDVYNSFKNKLLQSFEHEVSMGENYFLDIGFIGNTFGHETDTNLIDINFDGYNDLIFLNGNGDMGRNYNYTTYLFNKEDKYFHKNENFSSMINININKKDKTISEFLSEGCYSNCYTLKTYKIKNNMPILVKEEIQYAVNGDLNNIMNETYHFKNGKKIKVKSHKFKFN